MKGSHESEHDDDDGADIYILSEKDTNKYKETETLVLYIWI